MSSEDSDPKEDVKVVLEVQSLESTEDPPMEEWSSLLFDIPQENEKRIAFEEGLYHPGSGDICNKYIAMSDSEVFRHPYYNYPAVLDPGIIEAVNDPEDKVIYPDDGRDLYLAICKEMNQCPVSNFHKSLLDDIVDLSYYCVNPAGVRAMTTAMQFNKYVRVLNLTDNFLSDDACFHLGDMLTKNSTLKEINLSGCRIGPEGVRRLLAGLVVNRELESLNLNKNQLGDQGALHIASAIDKGIDLKKIFLSYNNIGSKAATALADAMDFNNKFTHIDLSWNSLFSPLGTCNLLNRLQENTELEELNLAWNSLAGPRIGNALKNVLLAPKLRYLDLSHNKLEGDAIDNIIENLTKAKKLLTLDMSFNPMNTNDALKLVSKMKFNTVKIQNLYMDDVCVDNAFISTVERIKSMKSKKNSVITHGRIQDKYKPKGQDARELVLNRVDYVAMKPKKNKVDIALVVMQLVKDKVDIIDTKSFGSVLSTAGAKVDDSLVDEIAVAFPGPSSKKSKTLNLKILLEYIKRKWPDRKLPPTPPPEPEPEPVPTKKEKDKAKGKGKGKK